MTPISSSFPNWYTESLDQVLKTPENNPKSVIKALETIGLGENQIEKKGLTNESYAILQRLSSQMSEVDPFEHKMLQNDLKTRIQTLFKSTLGSNDIEEHTITTFEKVEHIDEIIRHIASYTFSFKEQRNLAHTSRRIKEGIETAVDSQILSFLKESKILATPPTNIFESLYSFATALFNSSKKLPDLNLSSNYDFESIPFAQFKRKLPSELKLEKVLERLLSQSSEIKAGSPQEKLTLYLMKNVTWYVDKALKQPDIKKSSLYPILSNISAIFQKGQPEQEDAWDVMQYNTAYPNEKRSMNLENWAYLRLYDKINPNDLTNKQLLLAAMRYEPDAIKYVLNTDIIKDKEFIIAAIRQDVLVMPYLPDVMQMDPLFLSVAVLEHDGYMANKIDPDIKDHMEIALKMITSNKASTRKLSQKARANYTIGLAIVKHNGLDVEYLNGEMLLQHRDIAIAAVKQNGLAIEFLPKKYQEDEEIRSLAIEQNPKVKDMIENLLI